jgi:seryl-tRNA synthetase
LEVLLQAYQELSEEVKDPKTKSNLSSNCQNTKAFTRQIEALEKKLKELKDKKNAMLNKKEYIPPLPEISPESIDTIKDDNISLPGSEVPELSSDVPPLPDIDIQVME